MKAVEYARWFIRDRRTGKVKATTWKMPRDEALGRDPQATVVPGSIEVRHLPENDTELADLHKRSR